MSVVDSIRPIIEKKLAQMGLELYDIKFAPAGSNSVLRIYIDKDNGVSIDDCERVSEEISVLLDVENFWSTSYRLEVSSPGADRPLKAEKDFRRSRGRQIKIEIVDQNGKPQQVVGKVEDCINQTLQLQTKDGLQEYALADIKRAKIELSFK